MRALPIALLATSALVACGGSSSSSTSDAPASGGATQGKSGAAGSATAGSSGSGAGQAGASGGPAGAGGQAGASGGQAGASGGQAGAPGGQAGTGGQAGASGGQAGASGGQAGAPGGQGGAPGGQAGASGGQAGASGGQAGAPGGQAGAPGGQAGAAGSGGQAAGAAGAIGGAAIRFVALGDQGEGNDGQKAVGNAMANKCAAEGCDFAVLLGDNFYDNGVDSVTDPQWQSKFVDPYAALSIPFQAVLGNHDNGGNGAGWDFARGDNEVAYTKVNPKWQMPARHYRFTKGPVEFFALDTNEMMYGLAGGQKSTVAGWLAASTAPWRIALGHHPYLSNGPHGNAGVYEGIPLVPVTSGQGVKDFFDSTICGNVDVYLCGHDHSMQWLLPTCKGTNLIVSGAGAKTTELKGKNAVRHQSNQTGFFYIVVDDKTFYAEIVDATGVVEFSYTLTK